MVFKSANIKKELKQALLLYSVLNASTGSFLLAIFDGINPAIIVKNILINTSINPATGSNVAFIATPDKVYIRLFIGIVKIIVIPIPINPAIRPTINVSALNTFDISFLDAPIALNIPISFVLSNTDIYVIIPIIIDDTISEILTKPIKA